MRGLNHPGAVSEKARSTVHAAKHGQHMDNHGQTMALIASGGLPTARLARLPHPWEGRARGKEGRGGMCRRRPQSMQQTWITPFKHGPDRPGAARDRSPCSKHRQSQAEHGPDRPGGGMGSPAARPSPSSWTCTAPWPRSLACPPPPSSPISTAPTCGHFVFVV